MSQKLLMRAQIVVSNEEWSQNVQHFQYALEEFFTKYPMYRIPIIYTIVPHKEFVDANNPIP